MNRTHRFAAVSLLLPLLLAPGSAWARQAGEPDTAPKVVDSEVRRTRLQGSAFTGRKTAVIGASVKVAPEDDGSQLWLSATDEKGRFRFDGLPDGSYMVAIRREGLQPVMKDRVGVRFPARAIVELPMQPASGTALTAGVAPAPSGAVVSGAPVRIEGRVVDGSGTPVGEVALRLVRLDGSVDPRTVRSAADGSFALDGLAAGEWLISVDGLGYLPIRTAARFDGDARVEVVVVEQPPSYEPSPLDLLPDERPIPPPSLTAASGGS